MSLHTLTKTLIIGVVTSSMLGCASTSNTAPAINVVTGSKIDLAQLSGIWEGNFKSTVTKRSGSITLNLSRADNKAEGSVLLQYQKKHKKIQAPKPHNVKKSGAIQTKIKPLSVEFIAIEGNKVNGTVTPYKDPIFAGETTFTTYEGTLIGNRMEGTFTSRIGQNGNTYTGSWWAVRK